MDLKNLPRTEFASAVAQIAGERGIDPSSVLQSIEMALVAAYKRDAKERGLEIEEEQIFEIKLNTQTGEFQVIELADDKKKDVTPPGFGRIAAQTAKQVILQQVREAERNKVLAEYKSKLGNLVNVVILRSDPYKVVVGIGKTEAILPKDEQIPGRNYGLNQTLPLLIKEIRNNEAMDRDEIILSDTSPDLITELFRREVPEVSSGAVTIEKIVRIAGERTKLAVTTSQPGIDPVGSCVGQRGVRVQSVLKDLPENEKVDIVPFRKEIKQFLVSALSPAEGARVAEFDKDKKTALLLLPEDQLALAIGEKGENVRLASQLTGIEIKVQSQDAPEGTSSPRKAPSKPPRKPASKSTKKEKES